MPSRLHWASNHHMDRVVHCLQLWDILLTVNRLVHTIVVLLGEYACEPFGLQRSSLVFHRHQSQATLADTFSSVTSDSWQLTRVLLACTCDHNPVFSTLMSAWSLRVTSILSAHANNRRLNDEKHRPEMCVRKNVSNSFSTILYSRVIMGRPDVSLVSRALVVTQAVHSEKCT
jgi:hypothetical protein